MRVTKDCAYPDCEACQHPDCIMSETDITALLKRRRRKEDPEAYRQKQREYQDLRAETIKVIQGTSRLNVDLLNSLVAETSEQIKQLSWQIQTAAAELEETVQSASQVLREYDQLMGWAEMYDNCTFEAKKMIVAQFVKAVHVRRDYEIDIEFNVSFEEFQALYLEGSQIKQKGREQIRS